MPSPTGRLTNSNPSIEIMSAQQKVKECSTCAQGFNEDNNEVGVRIGSGCADEHKGPFVRILIATAPAAATAAPEIIGLMIAALDERDKKNKETSVVISQASTAMAQKLYQRVGFVTMVADPPVPSGREYANFDWMGEFEVRRTKVARDYLESLLKECIIDFESDFQLIDKSASRSLLNFVDGNIGTIKGGVNLVITPKGTGDWSLAAELCVAVELKTLAQTSKNGGYGHFEAPALVEFVAANYLSNQPSILVILTDLNTGGVAFLSYFDRDRDQIVVKQYALTTVDQVVSLISHHLTTAVVKDTAYVPKLNSIDFEAQRRLAMKRKFDDTDMIDALARFEDLAEGTADWSRGRAEATWNLLQTMGVDRMPVTVHHSMFI